MQRPNGLYRVNEDIPNDALLQKGEVVRAEWTDDWGAYVTTKQGAEWYVDSVYLDGPVGE